MVSSHESLNIPLVRLRLQDRCTYQHHDVSNKQYVQANSANANYTRMKRTWLSSNGNLVSLVNSELKDNNCPLRDVTPFRDETPLRPQLKLAEYDMTMMSWSITLYLYNWQSLKNALKNRDVNNLSVIYVKYICLIKLLSVSVQLKEIQ